MNIRHSLSKLNYRLWIKNNEPNKKELKTQRNYKFQYEPKISLIVPMYNTKEKYLKELTDSLINQTYKNWELCLADGSNEKYEYVEKLVSQDKRIKYKFLNQNRGISENSNEALKLATGDYIALLDHDDLLPVFSLYEIVKTINKNKDVELIYTDEDKIQEDKQKRMLPHFKQDYAPDTLLSYNYICHFSIIKKSLIEKLGGFRKEFDGSQDYDLILRATEEANQIVHIPKVLYHWRINENSVALSSETKLYAYEAAKKAISEHLKRINVKAKVEDTDSKGIYKINYEVIGNPKVSIIIQNTDNKKNLQKCINSITEKTTFSNYEIIMVENNKDINVTGDYIILLSNTIEIITPNWIEIMLGNCQKEDVGIVGAKILYGNQKIRHVGICLDTNKTVRYVNRGMNANNPGYMSRNIISQNYNCVSSEMLMISKKDYEDVGGLDERFNYYSDVDLCLKIRKKGKLVVMNPFACGYYFGTEKDSKSKADARKLKNKWKEFFAKEDEYFNVNFRQNTEIIRIRNTRVKW